MNVITEFCNPLLHRFTEIGWHLVKKHRISKKKIIKRQMKNIESLFYRWSTPTSLSIPIILIELIYNIVFLISLTVFWRRFFFGNNWTSRKLVSFATTFVRSLASYSVVRYWLTVIFSVIKFGHKSMVIKLLCPQCLQRH